MTARRAGSNVRLPYREASAPPLSHHAPIKTFSIIWQYTWFALLASGLDNFGASLPDASELLAFASFDVGVEFVGDLSLFTLEILVEFGADTSAVLLGAGCSFQFVILISICQSRRVI